MSAPTQPSASALRVAVLGAGSWGTALATLAARHHPTLLWARQPDAATQLAELRENVTHLPGVRLPQALAYTAELPAVWQHLAEGEQALIILGIPVIGLADICRKVRDSMPDDKPISLVWTCKGFDAGNARLPHEIVAETFAACQHVSVGALSGPSFAHGVAQGLPVALTVASTSPPVCDLVTRALHGGSARIYASADVIGVEVGGALKNIIAIACGICDGLQLGANARAALITRGIAEMTRLGVAMGAQADTLAGLTGLGDLVLTATDNLSRNRRVGLELGRGRPPSAILADGTTVEGVRCAQAALSHARALGVRTPIIEAVCDVLFHGKPPAGVAAMLMARNATTENPTSDTATRRIPPRRQLA